MLATDETTRGPIAETEPRNEHSEAFLAAGALSFSDLQLWPSQKLIVMLFGACLDGLEVVNWNFCKKAARELHERTSDTRQVQHRVQRTEFIKPFFV
tara:strand:- start:273 stop:563 length:291 start_codon:yes stop_codon:yes gene_type:complete